MGTIRALKQRLESRGIDSCGILLMSTERVRLDRLRKAGYSRRECEERLGRDREHYTWDRERDAVYDVVITQDGDGAGLRSRFRELVKGVQAGRSRRNAAPALEQGCPSGRHHRSPDP